MQVKTITNALCVYSIKICLRNKVMRKNITNIYVKDLHAPMRLDRYLKSLNPQLTQGIIEKALRNKLILVNDVKATSNTRVINDNKISYHATIILENENQEAKSFSQNVIILASKLQNDYLLYEDERILVINKPAKLATQGGTNISLSVDDALQYLNTQGDDLRLCHRLDRDTSGVVLLAKNRLVADQIMHGFKDKQIKKEYLAIVTNLKDQKYGTLSSYLEPSSQEGIRRVVQTHNPTSGGKIAHTSWQTLASKDNNGLLLMRPETGRMHQLRCHSLLISDGIVGDRKYGITSDKSEYMMLHSHKMEIKESVLGKAYSFIAPAPQHFMLYLKNSLKLNKIPQY